MPLSKEDLEAIRVVVSSSVEAAMDRRFEKHFSFLKDEFSALGKRVGDYFQRTARRFDEVMTHLDGLAMKAETRDQEFLALKHQVDKLEKKVSQ